MEAYGVMLRTTHRVDVISIPCSVQLESLLYGIGHTLYPKQ